MVYNARIKKLTILFDFLGHVFLCMVYMKY